MIMQMLFFFFFFLGGGGENSVALSTPTQSKNAWKIGC